MFASFGETLKLLRKQKKMSQQQLAKYVGVHPNTISGWERGNNLPDSKGIVLELAHQLRLDEQETRRLLEASLTALSPYWQVPYQRNSFFTGREEVLQQLHDTLNHEHAALLSQSYALSGLGGIGKTQTALEYAYRYANEYSAVFWISAETRETILSSYIVIATLLNLPEKQEQDQEKVVIAVTRWLTTHSDWLIIFDNVEDPVQVKGVLPAARGGSLLFTSRKQTLGFEAQSLDLEQMTPEEGLCFLLRRARLLDPMSSLDSLPAQEKALAQEIVASMDGLPLALDQAGAYIGATKCSLSDYLHLFQTVPQRLLDEHEPCSDHPLSVSRTFALALERVEQRNPLAAELLTACAFLAPDAIPDMFFLEGASSLGPAFKMVAADPLAFSEALKVLLSYSLIQRHTTTHTITVHRLVQAVLKGQLTEDAQHAWALRVIEAMSKLFPVDEEMQIHYWQACKELLPHALLCITLWNEDEILHITLLIHIASYLSRSARYEEAKTLFERALNLAKQIVGLEHVLMGEALYGLANLFKKQGAYAEAEPLYQRALQIWEQALGPEHPKIAESLNNLGLVYWEQSLYEQAEPLFQRALQIWEQALGPEHPKIARPLNSLGLVYWRKGQYEQAEPLYQRALRIWEHALGPEHPKVAFFLNNLAILYDEQGRYKQAEPLYQRALRIQEHALGSEHPDTALSIHNLGEVYKAQGQYEQAEPLFQRALRIWEQTLGPGHPLITEPLTGLAKIFAEKGQYEQAEPLFQRALQIREQALRPEHPLIAEPLTGLAKIFTEQGQYEQAEVLYQRISRIVEQGSGLEPSNIAEFLHGRATLLSEQKQYEQAEALFRQALALREQHQGSQHPGVAEILHSLADLYKLQQRATESLSLYQQALAIREQVLGPQHPKACKTRAAYTHLLHDFGHHTYRVNGKMK